MGPIERDHRLLAMSSHSRLFDGRGNITTLNSHADFIITEWVVQMLVLSKNTLEAREDGRGGYWVYSLIRLAAATAGNAALRLLELGLELLDLSVGGFEILVETISLGNELLLPLAETLLFNLDLLGEALAERLFLLLVLGVVELTRSGFAELASLHLLGTVCLVVQLFSCVDQVKHVGSDQNRAELLEIAVVLILDLGDTPRVLTSLDNASVAGLDILLRADDGERHGGHQSSGMLGGGLVILFDRWLVDLDALGVDHSSDL